uniref:Phosphomevalonate kinase n=1 Tax=Alona affinis TaxID=381656 RepID=A0A9N6ZEP7_9CRUS|nr:EOG090X0FYC [Alona affinis]
MTASSHNPLRIICFSGKRKSGKDYVTELLHQRVPGSVVMRLSAPIKQHWAESLNLDLKELLSDGRFKEDHRAQMIAWGEKERAKDPSIFCQSAIQMSNGPDYPFWIVADTRRRTDLRFFRDNYPGRVTTVRIVASDLIRMQRGFFFTPGVDDAESECDLDSVTDWDYVITNEGSGEDGNCSLDADLERLTNSC